MNTTTHTNSHSFTTVLNFLSSARQLQSDPLTAIQLLILLDIQTSPNFSTTQGEFVAKYAESQPNVSRAIKQLAALGYCTFEDDKWDKRTKFIHLTDKAKTFLSDSMKRRG